MIRTIIFSIFLIFFSCSKKIDIKESKINISNLSEPKEDISVELLSYYPASSKNQSNFYIVKNVFKGDTLFVVDIDNLPVSDFIKNYDGVENTNIILRKGKPNNRKEFFINIPSKYDLTNKKIFLGELIRLVE